MPRSLVWATDIDVLPPNRVIERHDDFLSVRSPSNPGHYWGNLLLFDDPPRASERERWEELFDAEFADEPRVRHRTFAWDRTGGELGSARVEFVEHGYELEETVGLVASPDELHDHPRANRDVTIRSLDPHGEADLELWQQVVEVQVAAREESFGEDEYRQFSRTRQADLRTLFRRGHGAWYVALEPREMRVLGSCGLVVTSGRGRFQTVDTVAEHRRQGICSRLLVEAGRSAAEHHGAQRLVIGADPHYHALELYETLGFRAVERVAGVMRHPDAR